MTESEFSRPFDVRQAEGRIIELSASETERAALARRFGIVRIDRLEATVTLARIGEAVNAEGRLIADIVQSCAVSAEDLPIAIDEPLSFRFVPAEEARSVDEEVELDADDCDEIAYSGTTFDLGEAVAQSVALAIDPFACGPDADEARKLLDDGAANPFAALKGMLKD